MHRLATRLVVLVLALAIVPSGSAAMTRAGRPDVPSWFRFDAARPDAIYSAWRRLSTRAAAVAFGPSPYVLAGRAVDLHGEPLRLTGLGAIWTGFNVESFSLVTDADGYFIAYGPPYEISETLLPTFTVIPGYPPSSLGWCVADRLNGVRTCEATIVEARADRAFVLLRADASGRVDADAFTAAAAEEVASFAVPRGQWRLPLGLEALEMPAGGRTIRLLGFDGVPVAGATVGVRSGGRQYFAETDVDGECEIQEPDEGGDASAGSAPKARVMVDALEYGFGPIDPKLGTESVTDVVLPTPATLSGTVVDSEGRGDVRTVSVQYRRACFSPTGLALRSGRDGAFSVAGIMPGEPFRLVASMRGFALRGTPPPEIATEYMVLKPGEARSGVRIEIPLTSAIRGSVRDADGARVPVGDNMPNHLALVDRDGVEFRTFVNRGETANLYGFERLGQTPFRLRITGEDYEPYESAEIVLEPGELRLVPIVLKRKPKCAPE